MNPNKFKHFYVNKYIVSPFATRKYYLCYNYQYKALWFRNTKVGSRTINQDFEAYTRPNAYIYSSPVGYIPSQFKGFFKFAFIRNPIDRFVSTWKNKVRDNNYFDFDPETYLQMQDIGNFISWVEPQDIDNCNYHISSQNSLIDLNHVDFIGRFESFQEDYQYVIDRLGLPVEKIGWKNRTKGEVPLTEEQRARLKKMYYKDYKLFYSQDL